MKDWYLGLRFEYKIAFWSLVFLMAITICLIPLWFFSLMEVPQGILLGGSVGVITYLLLGLFNNPEKQKQSLVITTIIMIVRFLLIAGILFLVGWLYYVKDMKAFNIFAVVGGYTLTIIVNIVLVRMEKVSGNIQ